MRRRGLRLADEIATFVEEVRALGPLNWPAPEALPEIDLEEAWRSTGGGAQDEAAPVQPEQGRELAAAGEALR